MPIPTPVRRAVLRATVAVAWLALAGCAVLRDEPPAEPVAAAVEPAPEPEVAVVAPAPPPAPAPVPVPRPRPPSPRDVVVLFQEGTAGYSEIAARIVDELPAARYRAVLVPIHASDSEDLLAPLSALRPALAVAVGREAAEFAREYLAATPLVFCHVFNYQEFLTADKPVWGVSALPPVALQLKGWTSVDPSRQRIGLIVSDTHSPLIDEAVAAAARGETVEFKHEVSSSDRETLYLFKRLAGQVDGFWLMPDNRILSPNVLRELLSYALAHEIGVLVFNDALLSWGALMSASSTPTDVARGVRSVLDRVAAGTTKGLPPMTPLSEIELRVNQDVASRLGVAGAPPAPWVLREPD
jgi:ABC-type uncharacterized transport system substrate-binding protein